MKRLSENRGYLEENDRRTLAIGTGIPPRGHVARTFTAVSRNGAVLIEGNEAFPWPIERVLSFDDQFYLAGPYYEGETVEELLRRQRGPGSPPWLTSFLRTILRTLDDENLHMGNVGTCLVTETGGMLFFDAALARELNRSIPADRRARVHAPYTDERLTGAAARAFQAAAILYHGLTGEPPVPVHGAEDRTTVVSPVHARNPAVTETIAAAMDRILSGESGKEVKLLREIDDALRENRGKWTDDLPREELDRRRHRACESAERLGRARTKRAFWRRNRTRLLVTAVLVVAVGSIPVSIVSNRLQPPVTAGLEPVELVTGYYQAWTDLDHVFMEDAVARGVNRERIREVTNIFVIDRVQTAHGQHGRLIPPQRWLDDGMPGDRAPYGVTDLELVLERETPREVIVTTRYRLWLPVTGEDESPIAHHTSMEERLTLVPARHGWEITEFQTRVGESEAVYPAPDR